MTSTPRTAVIGLGNEYRRDDGFGPAVIRALDGRLPSTTTVLTVDDTVDLLAAWAGMRSVIVVDLVLRTRPRPGRLHRWAVGDAPGVLGSHGTDPSAALALARVLGTAPGRVVVYAVEGTDVGFGVGLSPAVRRAVAVATRAIVAETRHPPPVGDE
ncbi:hydrogenase maturation protease [Prescottella defluvii]|uniref:hydrogenase maturation protease n=1 Tax=Prescottella defluvii TaxID=1323361 RepID=UPI0004F3E662|nr:hydrogenase maturation protease [Prescottella defluvii]